MRPAGRTKKKQRASGTLLAANMVLLALTAVGIYYLGDESLGPLAALTHLGLGLALMPPFIWHWVKGRRKQQQALPSASTPAGSRVVQFSAQNGKRQLRSK